MLNESRSAHILSLEDPIEFLHTPKKALVNQREIGRDSLSFATAMRGALREDPDVVIVGDLRDRETMRLAMVAAETGHLVVATMQTTGATATIDKLVETFPSEEQHQIRIQLAGSLKLIVSQILVPRADGRARVAVFEILKSTSSVRATIRDGKTFQLGSAMQIGRAQGMLTLDSSLEQLLTDGAITFETAYAFAQKKETFTKGRAAREGVRPSIPAPAADAPNRPSIPSDVSAVAETGPRAALPSMQPPPTPEPVRQASMQPMPMPARLPFSQPPPSAPPATRPVQPQPQPHPAVAQPQPATPARPAPAATPKSVPASVVPRKKISIPRDD